MRRRRGRLTGPCPIHRGDNPTAFVVTPERGLWNCFTGCARGGDVVDLVRALYHLSYPEAAHHLSRLAANSPTTATSPRPPPPRGFRPFTRRLHLDPTAPLPREKGIHASTARRFEAGGWQGPGFLEGCVAVRLHDISGRPLGYAGRRIDPPLQQRYGKWKFPPRLPKNEILYNLHRVALTSRSVVVVEGPWDVMRLAQLGQPAVALLGVHLSDFQRRRLARFTRIVLLFDGDDPGRRAAMSIRQRLLPVTQVLLLAMPEAKDPDDLDPESLHALLPS